MEMKIEMKMYKLLLIVAVVGGISAVMMAYGSEPPGAAEVACELAVDFSKTAGKIRPLNGVNNGPFAAGNHTADMSIRHKEAAFPSVRLHDCHWPHPDVVDIPAIFPLFHADAENPKNYVFGPTDRYLAPIAERGAEIVYRLGVSIEHKPAFHTQPPADFEKWAKICVNVIRHYNDGWADGKHYGIKYFEIWNEPDIGPPMWTGTPQQYFDLYRVAVTSLKAYNPALKIGGQISFVKGTYTRPFLAYCRDQKLPLDFLSWHRYSDSPTDLIKDAVEMRALLDEHGFKEAESLCTEWRPMLEGFNKVDWRKNQQPGAVRNAFTRNRNHESAAFSASALMQMQDAPLDQAHYYTADDSPWSMFDEFGEPGKVFFAFKAFHQLLQTSNRVAVAGAPGGNGVTACCGIADDGKSAGLLLSNYRGKTADLQIALKDFPLGGDVKVERFVVDEKHDYAPLEPLSLAGSDRVLRLSLPPATVMLLRLSAFTSGTVRPPLPK
jgi:xylan 1,4-beta-xylosidase